VENMVIIRKFEKLVLAVILGLILPVIGLLACWWGSIAILPEHWIPFAALGGLLPGLILDSIFLKRWVQLAHRLDIKLWMAIHLFYSACAFGFFMGVPVFNALLAIPAGFVMGSRLVAKKADLPQVQKTTKQTATFTTVILLLICAASAFFALASPSTATDLRGMLGLGFQVTPGMLIALILVGGIALLAFGWWLAVMSVRFSFTFLQRQK